MLSAGVHPSSGFTPPEAGQKSTLEQPSSPEAYVAKVLPLLHEEHEAEKLQVRGCGATSGGADAVLSACYLLPSRGNPMQPGLKRGVPPAVLQVSLAARMLSRHKWR